MTSTRVSLCDECVLVPELKAEIERLRAEVKTAWEAVDSRMKQNHDLSDRLLKINLDNLRHSIDGN